MNTTYGYDAYRSHDLNIAMKTSSGDIIKMDFKNEQSASMLANRDENGTQSGMSFSSLQSFNFSMQGNGLDEQDKKEIAAFMEIAQPHIDNFMKNLGEDAQNKPISKLAKEVASIFQPNKERSSDAKESIQASIVKMFDNALAEFKAPEPMSQEEMMEKIFENSRKLLEKTLQEFENYNKELYA